MLVRLPEWPWEKVFQYFLKDFLDHHVTYKELYDEMQNNLKHKEDTANEPAQ